MAIDWDAVENDYRTGRLSNRQIGERHGTSEANIRKRAKAGGWERGKVKPAPTVVLARPEASSDVSPLQDILAPKDFAGRADDLAGRLLYELDALTMNIGEVEAAIDAETAKDQSPTRRNAMMKMVSLPSRILAFKTLMQGKAAMVETGGGKLGKKEQAVETAKDAVAAGGRLAPLPPPKMVVDNTK